MPNKEENDKDVTENSIPGNPIYSAEDDIYAHEKKESFEEGMLEDVDRAKNAEEEIPDPASLDKGLDVPGADLDDVDEIIGEEDEENNYYSLDDQED